MRLPLALCALAMLAQPAASQKVSDYTRECLAVADKAWCEISRKEFVSWYPKALRGDYQGQRNVAYCLATGCDEAVRQDWTTACAWRMVLKAARHRRYDSTDTMAFERECGAARVDTSERADAARIAQDLFRRIYRRELPLSTLSRP